MLEFSQWEESIWTDLDQWEASTLPETSEEHDGGSQEPLDQEEDEGEHHGPSLTVVGRLFIRGGPGGVTAEYDDGALENRNIFQDLHQKCNEHGWMNILPRNPDLSSLGLFPVIGGAELSPLKK